MICNHQRNVTRVGDAPQRIRRAHHAIFVTGAERQTHAGHVMRIQHTRQLVGKAGEFKLGRGNQVKLRLFGRIHGLLSFALLRVN